MYVATILTVFELLSRKPIIEIRGCGISINNSTLYANPNVFKSLSVEVAYHILSIK